MNFQIIKAVSSEAAFNNYWAFAGFRYLGLKH